MGLNDCCCECGDDYDFCECDIYDLLDLGFESDWETWDKWTL